MEVRIASDVMAQLLAEAAATPSVEICGLLFGTEDCIQRAEPAANVAPDPHRSFELDPAALFSALRAARSGRPLPIGYYHSHPNGRPEPSARDLAAAEPGAYWLILGGGEARLWLAEIGAFREMQLILA
ncbi:M67 family metallopeptidase [Sphingomonas crusticola]|uniref:M67 family metallopeptidase n=1 Tax=Sphingomonas crusticola TaxID=1697973 RepID=UPI000E2751C3|nr:M67 family metallopeptidase [Sphingomonas crusticola]